MRRVSLLAEALYWPTFALAGEPRKLTMEGEWLRNALAKPLPRVTW
jgi:hypothetical protein